MKKQEQVERSMDEIVDSSFNVQVKESRRSKAKKSNTTKNVVKTVRLLQIAVLVLATLLLVRQNFLYALVLGAVVALTTAELVFNLVFKD